MRHGLGCILKQVHSLTGRCCFDGDGNRRGGEHYWGRGRAGRREARGRAQQVLGLMLLCLLGGRERGCRVFICCAIFAAPPMSCHGRPYAWTTVRLLLGLPWHRGPRIGQGRLVVQAPTSWWDVMHASVLCAASVPLQLSWLLGKLYSACV